MEQVQEPNEEYEPTPLVQAAVACTQLIADPKAWINRRVDTTELLSHEETRRRVSIDFTLSDDQLEALRIEDGTVVPISILTKQARRNFDVRDESGRSLPVLGKQQNGDLSHIALLSAVWDALPEEPTPEVFEMLAADLRQVVYGDPQHAGDALGFFAGSAEAGDPTRAAILDDETCQTLLDTLWANYVLFVVLPSDSANRRVVKFSYGDDFNLEPQQWSPGEVGRRLWSPDRRAFWVESRGAWRAKSFHAEIAIPEELRCEFAVLFDINTLEQLSAEDVNVNRAALYASDELDPDTATAAFVEVTPERAGRPFQAATTSVIVAALLWLGVDSGLDAKNPGAAVSLLLAGAAIFSGLSATQGRHRIVKRVFTTSRFLLAVVALAALAGSASLAMEIPNQHPIGVWRIAAIVCTVAALRLAWSAIRAPS